MKPERLVTDWIDQIEPLATLGDPDRRRLRDSSRVIAAEQGAVLFGPGRAPTDWLLLLEGKVRVQRVSENGREIVLYRVAAGESCILTTACLFAGDDYPAEGVAETAIKAAAVPRSVFDALVSSAPDFRRFVFNAYSKRVTELFVVVEAIAFQRVDLRLARKLLELAGSDQHLRATHQQLAVELGTAREVVSRQLQEFQRRRWIVAARGDIQIVDAVALRSFADAG